MAECSKSCQKTIYKTLAWNMCKIFSLVPSKKLFTRDTDTKKAEQFCKMSTKIYAINIKVDKIIQKDWNISLQIPFLVYLWWKPFPRFFKSFPRHSKWLVIAFLWCVVHILFYIGWFDTPFGSNFEIGTQIILLKIDGFLQRLILKYHPS